MSQNFIEIVLTVSMETHEAFRQRGREQTLEGRPGPLDFANTFCNLLEVGLKTAEVFGRGWGYLVLVLGTVVFLVIVIIESMRRTARQGISNGVTNLCNAKMCGRRCW
jgi:hypothetical protein